MATQTTSDDLSPALPPPPGTTPNPQHPATLKESMNIAMAVAIPLTTIFFLLRTFVRIWIKRQWICEDWLALIAWVGTIAFCGTGAATMAHHGGQHEWDITIAQAREASYWFNVASIHYGITICIAKLAVLLLYRRVFSPYRWSPFDIGVISLIILLVLFYIATNLTKIWECIPREKIWDTSIPGHCIDTPMLLNVSGLFNTITDFIIVFLPVRAVWNLNMKLKNKVMVVLAFTFGLCAPAFSLMGSIVRIRGTKNPDKTWVQPDIVMWGLAELTTGVLCVSFPEMGVLFKKKTWSRKEPSTAISKLDNTGDTQFELDQMNLISGQGRAESRDGSHQHQPWVGDVEVTREAPAISEIPYQNHLALIMAATNEHSHPERNRGWYQEDLLDINQSMRNLLENYSKVPSEEVVKHVNNIRERGFASNPYPCIGLYRFTILTLKTHPLYSKIVERLKSPGATYLDIGCCFGQDLRQFVLDGVPSQNLVGLDIEGALMEYGYELFLDRDTLQARFVVADVFKGDSQGKAWMDLEQGGVDVLHCSAFFHLFTLEAQLSAAKQIAKLIKKGGIIVGRQIGSVSPGDVAAIREGSSSYRHNVETFDSLWRGVGEATQTRWKVEGTMDMIGINPSSPVEDENSRRLLFTVTRVE
ncbi:hypothetical protein VPNG_07044 [Cytospora leucostoma]|uniref:Uncharacterized protein n=1 Tax=Cytospora leucostoma TaxID=1230097 RepID=A0A423WN79_9PEZI|nr:hypothetical protein VPNG_07044 [Cytospora leucostoma]